MVGDMIVNLYLKDVWCDNIKLCSDEYSIKRIFPSDKERLVNFIKHAFPDEKGWVYEVEYSLSACTCYIATYHSQIVGFACYDCSGKGYFGPFGVAEEYRKKGLGKILLYSCLDAMKQIGYGYAIIGWVADSDDTANSPLEFYKKTTLAEYISNSDPHYTLYSRKVSMDKVSLSGYEGIEKFRNE